METRIYNPVTAGWNDFNKAPEFILRIEYKKSYTMTALKATNLIDAMLEANQAFNQEKNDIECVKLYEKTVLVKDNKLTYMRITTSMEVNNWMVYESNLAWNFDCKYDLISGKITFEEAPE